MAGTRHSAVKMQQAVQGGEEDAPAPEAIVVEIPTSSKFGFAWPAELPSSTPLPVGAEHPVTLSSSEGETDVSEDESCAPVRRQPQLEDFGDQSEFATPTSRLSMEQNPVDQVGRLSVPQPRLSRAFSMPLPSQLGSLQNPRRSPRSGSQSPLIERSTQPELEHFRELSLELADSVQMVVQMLLQLSPPHVLDPVKEQLSACSLSIPTPSISAMFTSLKNLNYMSANMSALGSEAHPVQDTGGYVARLPGGSVEPSDFDVGEMLQSVGDAISGVAAHAEVDLVLFHGDVGMKHIAVRGDESGLSYTLSHIVRQIVGTAGPGDTVEVGLFIESLSETQGPSATDPLEPSPQRTGLPSLDDDGLLRCVFHISHRFAASDSDRSAEPDGTVISADAHPQPVLNTLILRRLLRHIGATLQTDLPFRSSSAAGRVCELVVMLERGDPSAVNPTIVTTPEDAAILGFPDLHIANEPTLEQLIQFTETLKGKSATLYANSKGSFAHHLSSYLTAWGINVSHMSTEPGLEGEYERWEEEQVNVPTASLDIHSPAESISPTSPTKERRAAVSDPAFILIDDDVAVLRSRLQKIKAEQAYPLSLHGRKRPSLASNHRPRSSPQVVRAMGLTNSNAPLPLQVVIVHFTSLSNYKLVKDAIQSVLTPTNGSSLRIPEVIVIPKPAGPRRFLTALHTAVTRPVVDPFFVPTATSPMSPGLHSISPFFTVTSPPKSPGQRSNVSMRTASDKSARSPKEFFGEYGVSHHPPSPLGQSDGREYFSDATVKLGSSPATGLVIQSPDGQPTGIIFHPKARSPSGSTLPPSPKMEPSKAQEGREMQPVRHRGYRIPSGGNDRGAKEAKMTSSMSTPNLQPSSYSSATPDSSEVGSPASMKNKSRQISGLFAEDPAPSGIEQTLATPVPGSPEPGQASGPSRGYMIRRQSSHATAASSPPTSPQVRSPNGQVPAPRRGRRLTESATTAKTNGFKKGKGATEGNIVPPISVLIVDDNPINQTILSTFMRRQKIKYDVAKNGEEAVQKWRSGVFHLILMDIQMPVMDGIQATKEIRRIEKQNAGFPSTPQSEGQQTPSEASTTDSRSVSTPTYRSSVIIVALTASSLQADRVAALAAGCNDFLTKPVALDWLNSKIIEWGSIKALQMWAEIRPEVVKSISTGQTAQAQQVARRLHMPEGRSSAASSTPATVAGARNRSPLMRRQTLRDEDGGAPAGAAATASTPEQGRSPERGFSGSSSGQLSTSSEKSNASLVSFPAITVMSPNEAAMTLAAHKPQVPVADIKIPTEALVSAVESSVPTPPCPVEEQILEVAATTVAAAAVVNESQTLSDGVADDSSLAKDGQLGNEPAPVGDVDDAPPPPPQPEPQ